MGKPNPNCDEYQRLKLQKARAEEIAEEEAVVHEDNEWGISLVDEDVGDVGAGGSQEVAQGISTAYSYKAPDDAEDVPDDPASEDTGESLEELMAKMGKL